MLIDSDNHAFGQIHLLVEGVNHVTKELKVYLTPVATKDPARAVGRNIKIPWKQVADFIVANGGSYHFGNATCRKKWDEINGKRGVTGE